MRAAAARDEGAGEGGTGSSLSAAGSGRGGAEATAGGAGADGGVCEEKAERRRWPAGGGWRRARARSAAAARVLEADSAFLDAEVRSIFGYMGEDAVTLLADQAVGDGKIASMRHFAVSSLGETPQHRERLTERGISPFRVLDPILWGFSRSGVVF